MAFRVRSTSRPAKLCMQHSDHMSPDLDAARIIVCPGFFHSSIHDRPRNQLQKVMKNDSLGAHRVDPFLGSDDSQPTEIE
jgi:hypothetical protein